MRGGMGQVNKGLLAAWIALVLLACTWAGCAKKVGPPQTGGAGSQQLIEHVVAPGETLRLIADNYYGDPERSVDIAEANGLSDPDRIVPGSVLRLRFAAGEWATARVRAQALTAYNLGVDLLAQDRLAEAETQFRLAVDTAPGLVSAQYNLALVLLKRGHPDQALPLLQELTVRRPQDVDFHFACGNALFLLVRFTEAVDQFDLALAQQPGHKRAAFGLARSLQEAGQREAARLAWQRYLELDGVSSWADTARRNLRQLDNDSSQ